MEKSPKKHVPLQDELPDLINRLRLPAGDDPRFATQELIATNREAFRSACHATWKHLHDQSLHEIMAMEALTSPERRKKMPPGMLFYFQRCILIWRLLNDALIWVLTGSQDHIIRAVCHRKDRPLLATANPKAMLGLLSQLNADPMTIAVWTDATTCVDLGDIYCNAPAGKPNGFMEVKEGTMNDKIFELMKVKGTTEEIVGEIEAFVDENGPKALKQLERVVRQRARYNEVMDIVQFERGFDTRRNAEVVIEGSHVELESYDKEVQAAIDSSITEPALRCVDGCLWVYVDRAAEKLTSTKIEEFRQRIEVSAPDALPWIKENFQGKLRFEAIPLERNLDIPEALPLFLRDLELPVIRDIVLGNLMNSIFVFLDWAALSVLVRNEGAELVWSSFKQGRQQQSLPQGQRLFTIGERVPRFVSGSGNYVEGFAKVYRIYFDGITPRSIVTQYVEALREADAASDRKAGSRSGPD